MRIGGVKNLSWVTQIFFDLCLFIHFSPVANFGQQSLYIHALIKFQNSSKFCLGRHLRKIGICFGNRPIADFFHDQTIFLKNYEVYIIGHSLLSKAPKFAVMLGFCMSFFKMRILQMRVQYFLSHFLILRFFYIFSRDGEL